MVDRDWLGAAVVLAVVALVFGALLVQLGLVQAPWAQDRERATVTVVDENGTRLATVTTEVADTRQQRYTGLSDHESLARGEGMLFVHDGEAERTYVMREMDFPLDIVFVGSDRRVTAVRHVRAPGPNEDGEAIRASGRAKWVLEVPRGYANETGISVGDRVEIAYGTAANATTTAGTAAAATASATPRLRGEPTHRTG